MTYNPKNALRLNTRQSSHKPSVLLRQSNEAITSKRVAKAKKPTAPKFVPRERGEHEAHSPATDLWERETYVPGDGEVLQAPRPGSQDFLKWPSHGDRT